MVGEPGFHFDQQMDFASDCPGFRVFQGELYSCTRSLGKIERRGDIKRKPDAEMKTLVVVHVTDARHAPARATERTGHLQRRPRPTVPALGG
jgi:hypothetical protein